MHQVMFSGNCDLHCTVYRDTLESEAVIATAVRRYINPRRGVSPSKRSMQIAKMSFESTTERTDSVCQNIKYTEFGTEPGVPGM